MSKKTSGTGRTRNFATVVYPDSAPENWQEILNMHFVPAFVSPLHDSDLNPTGEEKKPHYHVMVMFEGVKTNEQAKEIFDSINGVGCERVNSMRGYARYLCHLDNPEKAQYSVDDVRMMCGADYMDVIGLPTDKYTAITDMICFCRNNDLWCYADLFDYCIDERPDWARVLMDSGTYVIKEYLKSVSWKAKIKSDNEDLEQ